MTAAFAQSLGDKAELALLEPWHADEFFATLDRARPELLAAIPAAHQVHSVDDARTVLRRWADAHAEDTRHLFGIWREGALPDDSAPQRRWIRRRRPALLVRRRDGYVRDGRVAGSLGPGRRAHDDRLPRGAGLGHPGPGMRRVQWCNNPANLRSSALARRLGMTREGLLRSSFTLAGERWDNEVWSVLSEEWPTPAA
jgi:hypothetical protein